MKSIGLGDLDRRVDILRATETNDSLGVVQKTWQPVGSVWARYRPVSDSERLAAGQMEATLTGRFVVKWSPFTAAISPKDRVSLESVDYEISGVKEIARHRWIEITAGSSDGR